MRRWVVALAACLAAIPAVAADEIVGPARATAADTLVVRNTRIRLDGVGTSDAEAAKRRLADLVSVGEVRCRRGARLGHGVYAGTCTLADGRDVATALADSP